MRNPAQKLHAGLPHQHDEVARFFRPRFERQPQLLAGRQFGEVEPHLHAGVPKQLCDCPNGNGVVGGVTEEDVGHWIAVRVERRCFSGWQITP